MENKREELEVAHPLDSYLIMDVIHFQLISLFWGFAKRPSLRLGKYFLFLL